MTENPDGTFTKRLTLIQPGYRGANYQKTIENASAQGFELIKEREDGPYLLLTFKRAS